MPAYFWSCAGYSRKGERPDNEDNYFLDGFILPEGEEDTVPRTASMRSKGVTAVFDGMGGEQAGEYASFTAAYLLRQKRGELLGARDQDAFRNAVQAYVQEVNAKLRRRGEEIRATVGAAMAMLRLRGREAMICNLGDCRIYCLRKGKLSLLTRDHTLAAFLQRRGDLTPEEARTSRQKNVITRAVQPNQESRTKADCLNIADLQAGDYFYMCSDGMLEQAEDKEILNILSLDRSDDEKIEILRGATRENKDNHSAILIKIKGVSNEVGDDQLINDEKTSHYNEVSLLARITLAHLAT